MARYLLFDSAGATRSELAAGIARETNGTLIARSLHDPLMQDELDRGRPGWRWEPTLLEVDGGDIRIATGLALRSRLVGLLGRPRAWRVAEVVAESQVPMILANQSRRGFVKRGAAVAAGLAGTVLLGPGPRSGRAQSTDVESADFEADGRQRPGRYSRDEGIVSWRVRDQGSGYIVRFEHQNDRLSGEVDINYS